MDDITGSMLGILPVALAGGVALGFTKQAMQIPNQMGGDWEGPETARERMKRKKAEKRNMSNSLWGPPPSGIF